MSSNEKQNHEPELSPVDFDPFSDELAARLPLTGAQQEMWAACAMGAEASCSYNQCFPLRLSGELQPEALQAALQHLVLRHEALRVVFDPDGEFQTVLPSLVIELLRIDISQRSDEQRQAEIARLLEAEATTPFDLERGPLLRALLVREAPDSHVLIVTAHHMVCDGWSSGILLHDLGAIYGTERHGLQPRLAEPASYREYVREYATSLESPETRAAEDWWLDQLSSGAVALELPVDRRRPPLKSYPGGKIESRIDPELYTELKKLGASKGATLYATLLAAMEALLHRLAGQSEFIVGIHVAGQASLPQSELVGHCVNTLPLRVTLDSESSFLDHLASARSRLLAAQEHQQLTFGSLIRRLDLPRDPSRTPLVAVTFNTDRVGSGPEFPVLTVEPLTPPKRFVPFELGFNLVDDGERIVIECSYNTDLFTESSIHHWLRYYDTLLRDAVASPNRRLWELALVSESERASLVVSEGRLAELSPGICVHTQFEAQAARQPEAIALTMGETQLSYAELNRRANRLAHRLRERGVGPDVLVGLCLERSIEMVVGIAGILKAGGAYLPLDPAYPAERLAFMLEDAAVPVLVTAGDVELPHHSAAVVRVDRDEPGLETNPRSGVGPDNLAYAIYTSGSTGRPKGVEVTHMNLANFIQSMSHEPGLDRDAVLCAVTTLSFDIAGLELWLPLWVGARIVLADEEQCRDGEWLSDLLKASSATVMQATPSTWRMLLDANWEGRLQKVLCGGEPFPQDLVAPLLERADEVWNLYGPTETTVWSTAHCVKQEPEGSVPIGRPIDNTRLHVVDVHGALVPPGAPGELWIGGLGVARGYHERTDLTADRFRPSPFVDGDQIYRTGDLVRWRSDGLLEHLGRMDQQVKVNGFRIELGEIEVALAAHQAVRQAVATVHGGGADARLVGYVVVEDGADVLGSELRAFVRTQLPDYMVPAMITEIDQVPLTPNGKVDRKALPNPLESLAQREFVAPQTDLEKRIAEIWRGLLEVEQIGVHDNFFELGGHSILAIRALALISKETGGRLDPRSVFFQSLAQLASSLDGPSPSTVKVPVETLQ